MHQYTLLVILVCVRVFDHRPEMFRSIARQDSIRHTLFYHYIKSHILSFKFMRQLQRILMFVLLISRKL